MFPRVFVDTERRIGARGQGKKGVGHGLKIARACVRVWIEIKREAGFTPKGCVGESLILVSFVGAGVEGGGGRGGVSRFGRCLVDLDGDIGYAAQCRR